MQSEVDKRMTTLFAQRLQKLFETKRKPDGSAYTQDDVLQGTNGAITRVALWKLRAGRTKNPSYESIKALADFFHVSPAYFFGEPGDDETVLEFSSSGEQPDNPSSKSRIVDIKVEQIALRAAKLDDSARDALLHMIDFIENLELERKNGISKPDHES
jgi:transcriptional regulator with XRE-family HTH domain